VPSIRYTRDKRGYETVAVVHGYRTNQGQTQTRVLYLFHSPSHVLVGRRPLDDEAREALEHTHPDLRFDWHALSGEMAQPSRQEPSSHRSHRESRSQQGGRPAAPPAPVIVVDDQTVLGRTLGAKEAARLRTRYTELLQRIARRSRGPEERDQLTERAQRLNPDDWADAMAVRAGVSTVDAEWDAIGGELPQRRRGRRGGRRRGEPDESALPDQASAIIARQGDGNESPEDGQVDDGRRDTGGDGDPVWPGTELTPDAEPERDDLPGDD